MRTSSASKCLLAIVATLVFGLYAALTASAQAEVADSVGTEEENVIDHGKIVKITDALLFASDSLVEENGEIIRYIRSQGIGSRTGRSPQTAAMYAAVLPGLGQIYNHRYWKLPFLYGGAAALTYAIHFNNKYYKKYSSAYRDFLIGDPNNKSYMEFANRAHLTEEEATVTYRDWFQKVLSNKKNYYRRYRDLSIFGMMGLYVFQIVDASVDAHFFNFDVSDDLSLQWSPTFSPDGERTIGASVALTF